MTELGEMPVVLYQDEHFLILDKPPNVLSVPGRGPDKQDCLSARVQQQFPGALIVHRLDYDTSGIILMALHKNAQSQISRLFQEREIQKTYTAIVLVIRLAMPAALICRCAVIMNSDHYKSLTMNSAKRH